MSVKEVAVVFLVVVFVLEIMDILCYYKGWVTKIE